jgi:hypothetical protein
MPELCEVAGPPSTASVCDLPSGLKEAGHVERVEGRLAQTERFFAHPLVGQVRTGLSSRRPTRPLVPEVPRLTTSPPTPRL